MKKEGGGREKKKPTNMDPSIEYYSKKEDDEFMICDHCQQRHEDKDWKKVILTKNGFLCRSCFCAKCERLKRLNWVWNGVEVLDEEFEKKGDKYFCTICGLK